MIAFVTAGMVKNQKLPVNILTPTTKAADHDVPVTPDEVFLSLISCKFLIFMSKCGRNRHPVLATACFVRDK